MKRKFYIFFFFLAVSQLVSGQQLDKLILVGDFSDKNFKQTLIEIESNYNIKFYYKPGWIENIDIDIIESEIELERFLSISLKGTGINYSFVLPNVVVLLPEKSIVAELPHYEMSKKSNVDSVVYVNPSFTDGHNYLRGRKPDIIDIIIIGSSKELIKNRRATIKCSVHDKETQEPLIGATLYIEEISSGAASNESGTITMNLKPGKYTAIFQSLGMRKMKYFLDIRSSGSCSIEMEKENTSIVEVVVTAENKYTKASTLGMEHISLKKVKEIPSLMGEKDIIKISQMLPGIVSVSEASGGINVRGGNADQNLFYLNKIPIYNTSHLFGFFSAINPTVVKEFSIFKGHVPAEYGGRLSSVFEIETRKGSKNKFFTQGGVSPISANIELEIPIIKDKCSMVLSGRSSYSDWILKRLKEPSLRNSSADFYDLAGSMHYEMNKKNSLYFFYYTSSDVFNYNELIDYRYNNTGGSMNFSHRFNDNLKTDITAVYSVYDFSNEDITNFSESYKNSYNINHLEFKTNFNWHLKEKHKLNFGLNMIYYELNRGEIIPFSGSEISYQNLGEDVGMETAFYLDDKIQITPKLSFYAGFRIGHFQSLGPRDVYTYVLDTEKKDINIADTLNFDRGQIAAKYTNPQIRLALEFQAGMNGSLKLSYTEMSQYIFMLSNTISIAPNDQWKLADYHLAPPKSRQYAIGYFMELPASQLSLSSELYVKKADNIIDYKDGANFLGQSNIETEVLQGKQDAYGCEFMVSKINGKLNGWISYAYSRSKILVQGKNLWENINNGYIYPSNYDKPHAINLVANYRYKRRLVFSSNLVYSTGRPLTVPEEIFFIDGLRYVEYSNRNEYRMPDYFRMDFSITLEGNLKVKKPFHSSWMLSVYNLSGRRNPQSIFFRSQNGFIKGYKYSVIGAPIYTVTWIFKLGNYTNE